MFNKKLHIVILLFFFFLGVSVTFNGKTYSLVQYMGLITTDQIIWFQISLIFVLLGLIAELCFCYYKKNSLFYKEMYAGKYEHAEKMLLKYYKQNHMLFFENQLFFSFATGDRNTIDKMANQYGKKRFANKKKLRCNAYRYLLQFVLNEQVVDDLNIFIHTYTSKYKQEEVPLLLLKALQEMKNKKYQSAINIVSNISESYYYPCFAFVIYKIIFLAKKELGQDVNIEKEKLHEIANDDFLKICISKIEF